MRISRRFGVLSSGESGPRFSYTGAYTFIDDGNNDWRIMLLSSGIFTPLSALSVDIFAVGGGASARHLGGTNFEGGGGGGYTNTVSAVNLSGGTDYTVTIGAGGGSGGTPSAGGASSFASIITANGGGLGETGQFGGPGGSGGGGPRGDGGSDGSNGGAGSGVGGAGQGTTTREFGEPDGTLYAGGGAGGYGGSAGEGGGGAEGEAGVANTGGGAGAHGGIGGSGIIIIRNAR